MIQLQVINKVLEEKSIAMLEDEGIDIEYFDEYEEEYSFIVNHLNKYNNVPDVVTVLDQFRDFQVLEVRETTRYLIEQLKEEHLYNEMVPILQDAANSLAVDSKEAISELLPKIQKLLQNSDFTGGTNIAKNARDRLNWAIAIKEKEGNVLGIKTGFELLDDIMSGMLPGEDLIVIVGRPGDGKSWTIDKMLASAWQQDKKVLLYSGEMSENQVGSRVDTLLSSVSINAITKGLWNDYQFAKYKEHIEFMAESDVPFTVVTPSMLGGKKMTVSVLESMIRRYQPDVIGIDQLSLMEDDGRNYSTREKYGNISAELYKLSATYKIPIILNVQANRNSSQRQDKRLILEDIAEADAVGQNASRVITMYRDDEQGILTLGLIKNRYGEDNKEIEYVWDVETGYYKLIGYADNTDENVESNYDKSEASKKAQRTARRSSREVQSKVDRSRIEAF